MRNSKDYKIIHVKRSAHDDLSWIKQHTGKAMTDIIADLARATREGMEEETLRRR